MVFIVLKLITIFVLTLSASVLGVGCPVLPNCGTLLLNCGCSSPEIIVCNCSVLLVLRSLLPRGTFLVELGFLIRFLILLLGQSDFAVSDLVILRTVLLFLVICDHYWLFFPLGWRSLTLDFFLILPVPVLLMFLHVSLLLHGHHRRAVDRVAPIVRDSL